MITHHKIIAGVELVNSIVKDLGSNVRIEVYNGNGYYDLIIIGPNGRRQMAGIFDPVRMNHLLSVINYLMTSIVVDLIGENNDHNQVNSG